MIEFDINICTASNGKIIVEDYSLEKGLYISGHYEYRECKTINVFTKIETKGCVSTEYVIHHHDQLVEDPINPNIYIYDLEKSEIILKNDGYYILNHIILPTKEWFENQTEIQSDIYIIDSDNKFYKYVDEEFVETDIEEIIRRNPEGTTIEKCVIDIFYTGFLQECYINYCKKLFDSLTKNCDFNCIPKNSDELTYIRDFLWMVLNIIDYLIGFKQYIEAQRILEIIDYCGGFCKNKEFNVRSNEGCGCS